jgi:asparagine N-glycosylation enzyme membrane subunit Stt3
MLTIAQFLIQSIPVFISIAVPGFLMALALLRKTKLHLFELFFIGIVFGIATPSIMAFIEFLVGIPFSLGVHLANLVIICLISVGVIVKDKINILPKSKLDIKTLCAFLILAAILFLAWWIRLQAISPFFYEFDPYWYNTVTEFIIKSGGVSLHSDNAWWPQPYDYRVVPIVPYTEASWYNIYAFTNGIKEFDFTTMTLVSSLYPAIAAALMCFFAYLWLSKEYGKAVGILAAGFLAFTPVLIDKMLAGEFEMQPWGLFGIIFFLAFYALTLKTNSKRFALVTAFAIMICYLGSGAGILPIYLAIGVSAILSIIKFLKNELDINFIYVNIIIAAGILAALGLNIIYQLPASGDIPGTSIAFMGIGFLAFIGILFYLRNASKTLEEKLFYLSSIFVIGMILVLVTPLGGFVSGITNLVFGVVTYTDPTFQTIAEQTVAGSSLHESIGILGTDVSDFSLVPVIVGLAAIPLVISLIYSSGVYALLGLVGVLPISMTGLFKVKYTVYSGLFVPLMFCFGIGEICNKAGEFRKYILALVAIVLFVQAMSYYDIVVSSIGIANRVDITSNAAISKVCNDKYADMKSIAANMSIFGINASIFGIQNFAVNAKSITQRAYCNLIPDHWLNAMYWLRDNTALEDRTICWWDYGHWITTFGQRKSVTDNTHWYTLMHQEVADKIVYNTPEALTQYMREHKAKYLLLDQDLIAKWGALVYHACYYNNKTDMKTGPGGSECDREYSPEFVFIPNKITSDNLCSGSTQNNMILKVYSPYFLAKGTSKYYCVSLNSLNEGLSLLQYGTQYVPLSFTYEDGKKVGITNGMFQGQSGDYLMFLVTYPSDSLDRKGKFYDSVFYKGFFEGNIPGFVQVHPSTDVPGPVQPVRIYKIVG